MTTDNQIKTLKAKIEQLEEAKKTIEEWRKLVSSLDDFTVEQKIEAFDAFYTQAIVYMEEVASGHPEPDRYWVYELVMTKCLGENVFKTIGRMQP